VPDQRAMTTIAASPVAADGLARLPSQGATIAAYDELAREYDHPSHDTTRQLEILSRRGLAEAFPDGPGRAFPLVLEVGCGTGSLTSGLIERIGGATLLASDSSKEMLQQAKRRLPTRLEGRVRLLRSSAWDVLNDRGLRPDMVACGLADPYMSIGLLRRIARRLNVGGVLFLTLPSRAWAATERTERLGVGLHETRFRLRHGKVVVTRSLALDESALRDVAMSVGFRILRSGLAVQPGLHNPPAVSWILATPIVTSVPLTARRA
jgi:SAM-dependent methyltransferase